VVVEPVPFSVGPLSHAFATFLAGGTLAYAALTGLYTVRAFRIRLEDRWSSAVATLTVAALGWLLHVHGPRLLPAPFSIVLAAVFVAAIAVTLTYTLGRYQERIERFTAAFGQRLERLLAERVPEERYAEWQRLRAAWQLDKEGRRKLPHLLMGVYVAVYAGAGFLVLRAAAGLSGGRGADEVALNLAAAAAASPGAWLVAGQLVGTTALLGLLYLLVPTELLRLRFPELSYPFKSVILSRLRQREKGLFGAHYYIAAAMPLAALWLTREPEHWDVTVPATMAIIAVAVFADAASALVGTRLGKAKWFHNPKKSYLGTLGGTAVAFLVALPFVGVPVAVASAVAFLVLDIVAPVPVAVSDNLLNPLGLALVYDLMQGHLDPLIPYY
jgi:dolichol kinase